MKEFLFIISTKAGSSSHKLHEQIQREMQLQKISFLIRETNFLDNQLFFVLSALFAFFCYIMRCIVDTPLRCQTSQFIGGYLIAACVIRRGRQKTPTGNFIANGHRVGAKGCVFPSGQ